MSTEKTTLTVFDVNNRYTRVGTEIARRIHNLCHERVIELVNQGYTSRTAMVVGSTPTVSAESYNVDPLEFHALWMMEIQEICLERILDGRR